MTSLPSDFELTEGTVLVLPLEHRIQLHRHDVVVSHTLQLPRTSILQQLLKPHSDLIQRLYKQSRDANPLAADDKGSHIAAYSGNIRSVNDAKLSPKSIDSSDSDVDILPLPITVDIDSEPGKVFAIAISEFSSTLASHIQTVINTCLQLAWEGKRKIKRELAQQQQKTLLNFNKSKFSSVHSANTSSTNLYVSGNTATAQVTGLVNNNGTTAYKTSSNFANSSQLSLVSELSEISDANQLIIETWSSETDNSLPSVRKGDKVLSIDIIGDSG